MSQAALAEDTVSIRHVHARGVSETSLRRQLAAVPTPRVRRYVFVRRVTLRAAPLQIGRAMEAALAKLAEDSRSEILTFADFPALAVACARAALAGGRGGAWYWRILGLPPMAGPGEALAALMSAHPLEAGSAVAALAEQGLLVPVWRELTEAAAARLTAALALAAGFSVPAWPDEVPAPFAIGHLPASTEALLERAATVWAEVLMPLPPRSEAVLTAAVLSLLRWSPGVLRSAESPVWPALLARIAGGGPAARGPPPSASADQARPVEAPDVPGEREVPTGRQAPSTAPVPPSSESHLDLPPITAGSADAAGPITADLFESTGVVPERPYGQEIVTGWGGVLFLINALQRLEVDALVAASPEAPSGWRLLHDLGVAFGLPEDEPLACFLAAQDLGTAVQPPQLAALLDGIEALYRPDGPWPLPLAQPARLRATETHLDLDLAATTIDLALRLAGLDLDPGWVPWLGRVVTFHYDQLPTYHRGSG